MSNTQSDPAAGTSAVSSKTSAADLREERLRTMPIGKLLSQLSLPAMFAMFINALYNFVDAMFVGQGVGPLGIAGLSIAFPLQMLIGAVGLMIGMGGASLASRFLGARKKEEANHSFGTAVSMVLILSVISYLLLSLFLDDVLIFVGATGNTLEYARDYSSIILMGFIPLSMAMTANNFIRAEGNARMSMLIMLSGALVNIVLDPIFIFALDWGIRGAALATIIGQVLNFILSYTYLFSKHSNYRIRPKYFVPRAKLGIEIMGLGVPTLLRQLGTSALLIVVNNVIRSYSVEADIMIAVMGVVNRLMMFSLMPLFGLVQGMQPIAGYNYGAKQYSRVQQVMRASIFRGVMISLVFFAMFMIIPGPLMRMFGDDQRLILRGTYFLRVVFLMTPIVAFQIVGAAYFQALGKMLPAFFLSTSRQLFFLIPLVLIFAWIGGVNGMAWAFPASDFLATVLTMIWYRIDSAKLFTLKTEYAT